MFPQCFPPTLRVFPQWFPPTLTVFPQCFPPTLLMTSQCTSHDLLVLLKCDNSPHPPIYNLNTLIVTTTGGLVCKHVTVPTHVVGRETDWAGRSKYAPRRHTQFFTPTPVCAGFHLGGTFPSRHWCHCQCCSTFSCRQSYRIPIL
ncbi:hypothetical protein Pcinc_024956 [Petrolisthes cinctipes]|uniref:Uncharacterized protein n=1 Tax=Petrolisthes cinctipes TaxID=88211 RepID=A0AAE1F9G5_PETCI|nr:hypothetical protein Pcinc_024956 [Petrolisthes cinctipes]